MQAAALRHVADERPDRGTVAQRIETVDPNLSVEVGDAQDAAQERRLARAVGAEQQRDLAGVERQRHARERHAPAVALGHITDLNHRAPRLANDMSGCSSTSTGGCRKSGNIRAAASIARCAGV